MVSWLSDPGFYTPTASEGGKTTEGQRLVSDAELQRIQIQQATELCVLTSASCCCAK